MAASDISVRATLALLDGPFADLATGVAQGRYAFWLGSGISRDRVDNLKQVIRRVLVHLQTRIDPADRGCRYLQALGEALQLAQLSPPERAAVDVARPVDTWPILDTVLQRLSREYARLLDIPVQGEAADYLLWEAVDVVTTFAPTAAQPDCEHLCLGILAIEGVVPDIASANWDGLVEAGVHELTGGAEDIVAFVRADNLRELRLRTRLLKFHGCAVRAGTDAATSPFAIDRASVSDHWLAIQRRLSGHARPTRDPRRD